MGKSEVQTGGCLQHGIPYQNPERGIWSQTKIIHQSKLYFEYAQPKNESLAVEWHMKDWPFAQIIKQWGQKEKEEHKRGGLRLRGGTVRTSHEKGTGIKKSVDSDAVLLLLSSENNKNKNFMFIILCYNLCFMFYTRLLPEKCKQHMNLSKSTVSKVLTCSFDSKVMVKTLQIKYISLKTSWGLPLVQEQNRSFK